MKNNIFHRGDAEDAEFLIIFKLCVLRVSAVELYLSMRSRILVRVFMGITA